MPVPGPADLPITVGQVIAGRYAVSRIIGRGGMGVVLEGRHLELGERVAIKFLNREHMAHSDRFFREAKAAARIKSEHVVRVYDVGRLESGEPYIVMEYLEGDDLSARLDRLGQINAQPLADILLDVCEALAEAHAAGIVHRDLKPANIFLSHGADGEDLVKLLDFGVAKVPDADAITRTASVLGSPLYMSPEQLMASRDVDARSDIWSLGIVMYEALTGSVPFKGDSLVHLALLIREKPTPRVRELRPELSEELDAVVGRCLAKDRGDRFADVAAFAEAIAPFASANAAQSVSRIRRVLEQKSARRETAALGSTLPFADTTASDSTTDSGARDRPASVKTLDAMSRSAEAPTTDARPAATPWQAWVLRGIVALVACAALAFVGSQLLARSRSRAEAARPKPVDEASAQVAIGASTPAAPATTPSASPAPSRVEAPPSAAPPPKPPSAALAPRPPPAKTNPIPPTVATSAPAVVPVKPAPNCNPPYTIDENGLRRAKPECL
jgi:serine/threonine-protein kinase